MSITLVLSGTMKSNKPRVLIGPMFTDPSESVSLVNRTFVAGLSDRYEFIHSPSSNDSGTTGDRLPTLRKIGRTVYQAFLWVRNIVRHRPQIAHYALSSGWAMEKCLVLLALARISGLKTIAHLHSGGFPEHWKALPAWRSKLAIHALHKLDALVVLSPWWRSQMQQMTGLPHDRIRVIGNPIDPAFMNAFKTAPAPRTEPRILSLGTLGRDKGVHELVQACAMLREDNIRFHLDIVGPERECGIRKRVEREINNLNCGDFVTIRPPVFGDAKIAAFQDASIFVLPSHYENFPLVLLEAAAAGLAIVTTPVGAVPEMLEDGVSAAFVPPGSAPELAMTMKFLLESANERTRLGESARARFLADHDNSRTFGLLDNLYQSLAANGMQPMPVAPEAHAPR